ncbi:hypothetical protein JW711_02740 [Candidatus Woesearchaeota archaeon]|nr:hypothetical protein [Candidatus Woesearchaeota archaeon]
MAKRDLERRILVIDDAYLSHLPKNYMAGLAAELSHLSSGDEVHLHRPHQAKAYALYADVRSLVAAMSIKAGYRWKTDRKYDDDMMKAGLGNRVVGSHELGYSFDRRSRPTQDCSGYLM